jgi:hypothetical protein
MKANEKKSIMEADHQAPPSVDSCCAAPAKVSIAAQPAQQLSLMTEDEYWNDMATMYGNEHHEWSGL